MHQHNLKARLLPIKKSFGSHDLVGDARRELLREAVLEADYFNLTRAPVRDWSFEPQSSPFSGLLVEDVDRFILRMKESFMLMFSDPI